MKISDDAYLQSATSIFIAVRLPELRESGLAGDELAAACVRGIVALHVALRNQYGAALKELQQADHEGRPQVGPVTFQVPSL